MKICSCPTFFVCLFVNLLVCQIRIMIICQLVCITFCLSVRLSIYLSVWMLFSLLVCLSCLSVNFVFILFQSSVCLFVCMSFRSPKRSITEPQPKFLLKKTNLFLASAAGSQFAWTYIFGVLSLQGSFDFFFT